MPANEVYELIAIRYATLPWQRSRVFLDYHLYDEPDGTQDLDYYLYLVRNDARTIVVDTGYSAESARERGRDFVCPPLEALGRLGVAPTDVDTLLLTHLHFDHTGHADAFVGSEIYAPATELAFWASPAARNPVFAAVTSPDDIAWIDAAARAGDVRAIDGETEIAPGVVSITVGGHSPGQQIVEVGTAAGTVILASDAAHLYEELELRRPFHVVHDVEAMVTGFDFLDERAALHGSAVVPGHDPMVMDRYPRLPGDLADLGVRLG